MSRFLSTQHASSDYEQSFVIAGRYQSTRLLAETCLSDYYWATDLRTLEANNTQSSVILALVKPTLNQVKDFNTTLERVLPEFSRSSGIEPFVSDSGHLSDGRHWFVLPNLEGTPLSEKIRQVGRHGLPVKETLLGAENILQAIRQSPIKESFGYLEPGAVLCGKAGDYTLLNTPLAVTLKLLTSSQRSAKGKLTLHSSFISPEVGMGNVPGEKDDVFSLACIVYQMLNGHLPFVLDSSIEAALKETVPATVAKLPTHRWHCLQNGMSFKREERQDNPEALLFQLNNQVEEKPKRNLNFVKLAGIACLGIALYTGYTFYSSPKTEPDAPSNAPDNAVLLQLEAETQQLAILQKQREAEAKQLAELQQQREFEVQKLAEIQQQRTLKESEIEQLAQLQQQEQKEAQQLIELEKQQTAENIRLAELQKQKTAEAETQQQAEKLKKQQEEQRKAAQLEKQREAEIAAQRQAEELEQQRQAAEIAAQDQAEELEQQRQAAEIAAQQRQAELEAQRQALATQKQREAEIAAQRQAEELEQQRLAELAVQRQALAAQKQREVEIAAQNQAQAAELQRQRAAEANRIAAERQRQQQLDAEAQRLAEIRRQEQIRIRTAEAEKARQQQVTLQNVADKTPVDSTPPVTQTASQPSIRPPGAVAPRMIQTGSRTRFPSPRPFGPIDPDLQARADSSCRGIGALSAIGYHPQALQLDGSPFPGGAYYCHFPDADPNEVRQIGAHAAAATPKLVIKKSLAWDNPATFGGVPAALQTRGNSVCRESGFTLATGYHPDALDEDGQRMTNGGYLCK